VEERVIQLEARHGFVERSIQALGSKLTMSQLIKLLSVAFLAIFLSGVGRAAETPPSKEAPKASVNKPAPQKKTTKAKKPKVQKFVGNISAIDTKSGAVSVKGSDGEKNFITQDAAKDALERLAVGDRIRVQYTEKDGKLMSSSVRRVKLPQTKNKTTEETAKSKSTKTPSQQKSTKDAVK
jgi:hypothetical protein